jgi:2-C-methyl-D-erythritol 4-phosphate cytidylyltransferase
MNVCLIIPAGGASSRYMATGGLRHKLDEDLGGRPVLQRTIELFVKHEDVGPMIQSVIVAGPHDEGELAEFKARHGDRLGLLGAKIVRGGKEHRYETVQAALLHVPTEATHVAVHDAARPCTSPDLLDRVFEAARSHGAVIPAVELADTIKRVKSTDEPARAADPLDAILGVDHASAGALRVVAETVPRKDVWLVQTPQVFEVRLLRRAYSQGDLSSTDDAGLVERLGERVVVVAGDARNIKITWPSDLSLARAILGVRPPEGRATHKKF